MGKAAVENKKESNLGSPSKNPSESKRRPVKSVRRKDRTRQANTLPANLKDETAQRKAEQAGHVGGGG